MYINDKMLDWEEIGQNFLRKYQAKSARALNSDLNRILDYFKSDHGMKQIEDIKQDDIEEIILIHVQKEDNALSSKNSVYKFIVVLNMFFEYLKHERKLIESHVFREELYNIKEFKKRIAKKMSLKDEGDKEFYDIHEILQVVEKIDNKLSQCTKDQEYRLIQQSIYIQLTLLTALPRRVIASINLDEITNSSINGYIINYPKYTSECIQHFMKIRKTNDFNHSYFFTSIFGEDIDDHNRAATLFNANSLVVNYFKDIKIIDSDISCFSGKALINTALMEMIKTNGDLYPILKLSNILNSTMNELDNIYMKIYGGKNSLILNREINIQIMRLSYYEHLNQNLFSFSSNI